LRLTLEATLINGDTASTPRAFDGLSKRLPPGNPMAINNASGAIPGAPLNFDRLDELIDSVNAYGGSKVLVMSKAMRRQLNALARASIGGGVYQTSTNSYGMTVHRYQDCDILTVDRDALVELLARLPKEGGLFIQVGERVPVGGAAKAIQAASEAGFAKISYVGS
jgi:hypothetical protein